MPDDVRIMCAGLTHVLNPAFPFVLPLSVRRKTLLLPQQAALPIVADGTRDTNSGSWLWRRLTYAESNERTLMSGGTV